MNEKAIEAAALREAREDAAVPYLRPKSERDALEKIKNLSAGLTGSHGGWEIIHELATDALSSTAGKEWRDISSAPRDGTPILIWDPADDDGETYKVAEWGPKPYPTGWSFRGGWRAANEPTHWMPLPAPPVAEPLLADKRTER